VSETVPPPEDELPPGCLAQFQSAGLAIYALLVLAIAGAGLVCGVGSMVSMVRGASSPRPGLVSGADVDSWRLAELRRLGRMGSKSPALYYDSSARDDGSTGCLVTGSSLLSWSQGGAAHETVELAGSSVALEPRTGGFQVVVSTPSHSATCAFRPGDDAQRFFDMLQAEARR